MKDKIFSINDKQFCVYWSDNSTNPLLLNGGDFFSHENGFWDEHIKEISELEVGQTWSFDGCFVTRIVGTIL